MKHLPDVLVVAAFLLLGLVPGWVQAVALALAVALNLGARALALRHQEDEVAELRRLVEEARGDAKKALTVAMAPAKAPRAGF